MSKTIATAPTIKKRKGYLIPIPDSDLEGEIIRGSKYVRIREAEFSKRRNSYASVYYKRVRVWGCTYCGNESRYMAVFHYSGYDMIERLCKNCVNDHRPIPGRDSESAIQNSVPVCNLL